jgi:hypothetical protein
MSTVEKKAPQVQVPSRGIVGWRSIRPVLEMLAEKCGVKLSVDGAERLGTIEGGFHVKVGAGSEDDHPFLVEVTSLPGGGVGFTVVPGTFAGQVPTLGGVALNAATAPVGTLGSGVRYVYLKATYAITTVDDYVSAGTLSSVVVEVTGAEESDALGPKGPGATVEFYILLASYSDGTKTGQYVTTSLGAELCGIADDSGMVNLLVFAS